MVVVQARVPDLGDVRRVLRHELLADEDVIEPEVTVEPNGVIPAPLTAGLGYEIRERRVQELTVRQESYSARPESVAVLN